MAGVLDTEIQKYLPLLGNEEKKSLLSVIKSFLSLRNEQSDQVKIDDDKDIPIPEWQMTEIRKRKEYYKQHPEELISWEAAQKMIHTD